MREIQIISISILLRKYSTQCFFSCVLFFNPIVFLQGYEYWCIAWVSIFYKWCQYSHCCHRWWRLVIISRNFCREIRLLCFIIILKLFFQRSISSRCWITIRKNETTSQNNSQRYFQNIFFVKLKYIINFASNWN